MESSRSSTTIRPQVAERGGLRVQNGFFARFCIDRMGIAVQSLRDNPPGVYNYSISHVVQDNSGKALLYHPAGFVERWPGHNANGFEFSSCGVQKLR